jgi:DNA mismatch endonuclease (patch repair protein)
MRGNKRSGTRPEIAVRKAAHQLGARYRLRDYRLPGKPDLVLPRRRIAIFVHGCFWHDHTRSVCTLRRSARPKGEYWRAKIARNVERDDENLKKLTALGWRTAVIWECETSDKARLTRRLSELFGNAR